LGGYAQGGRISAPIYKQWAQVAFKELPKTPFVAPAGIRWVRVDRATGKPVFGIFPTDSDPKPEVIWEAFQPQTELRRANRSTIGDPYAPQQAPQQLQAQQTPQKVPLLREPNRSPPVSRPAPVTTQQAPAGQPIGLPTQNGI
jgi:penicillin-binding protein 1A